MSLLTINRWHNTFRARRRLPDEQLQRWHKGLDQLDLGSELDSLVGADEWLLIRQLRLATTLGETEGEWQAGESWRQALSRELREQLEHGPGDNVVYYRQRRDAVADMLYRAACADTRRHWAWQQMGLLNCPAGATPQPAEVLRQAHVQLLDEPPLIWPVITRLIMAEADTGALSVWIRHTPAATLKAVLSACPQTRPYQALVERPSSASEQPQPSLNPTPQVEALMRWVSAHRWLARNHMLEIMVLLAAASHPADAATSAMSEQQASLMVLAASRALMDEYFQPKALGMPEQTAASPDPRIPVPTPRRAESSPRLPQAGTLDAHVSSSATLEPAPLAALDADESLPAAPPLPSQLETCPSQWGGLLFLLHCLPATGWLTALDNLSQSPEWTADSARALLWQLATVHLGIPASDPAVRAFCGGWQPHARELDQHGQLRLPAQWCEHVEQMAARLAALVAERLAHAPDLTLAALCQRPAAIAFEPGWIDVHFSVEHADTRLRRVGFDLDPGWLPWLGCVVRFVYE